MTSPLLGPLEDHTFHISVRCVNCFQMHWLKLQNGISVCVSCRYLEYYKSPMEQMHERCENYPPCDFLSDQIGFALAYSRYFGRYWVREGRSLHPKPPRRKKAVVGHEGRKSGLESSSTVSLTSWNPKAGIISLAELPLTFFLSLMKSLFRHFCGILSFTRRPCLYLLPLKSPAHNRWKMVISFKTITTCLGNNTRALILFCKIQEDYRRRMSQCV